MCIRDRDYSGAIADLKVVLEQDPGNAEALFYLGVMREETGFLDEAKALYSQACQADPQHARAINNRGVLLLHANELNADHVGTLFDRLRQRGYHFVPLSKALEDPAYSSADRYVGRWGNSWMHHWEQAMGRPRTGAPDPPAWVSEAYEKGRR